jgi:hypothetical protein
MGISPPSSHIAARVALLELINTIFQRAFRGHRELEERDNNSEVKAGFPRG